MARSHYSATIAEFASQEPTSILGDLVKHASYDITPLQRNAWISQIEILQRVAASHSNGWIELEYNIPRMGKRIDTILLIQKTVFVIEFKTGSTQYDRAAIDQVIDYASDLHNFHSACVDALIIPILVATEGQPLPPEQGMIKHGIHRPLLCNQHNLVSTVSLMLGYYAPKSPSVVEWRNGTYSPTPTIVEAARALYAGHTVADISRNDASATNLEKTSDAVHKIIDKSHRHQTKSICFITGVPGAGKTLAGLTIANRPIQTSTNEVAVLLSGNLPLVTVLQHALARDEMQRFGTRSTDALQKTKSFIQPIHHFRDDALSTSKPPIEHIAIFDESQRAWNAQHLEKFMIQKRGYASFSGSEPEFLISVMDRHQDWAVIVCLVGGGQEIHTGEAGLAAWFAALRSHFSSWNVYVSNELADKEFIGDDSLNSLLSGLTVSYLPDLHLSTSLRSFRSIYVSEFVKHMLDISIAEAASAFSSLHNKFPILLTRDYETAKNWVRRQAIGTERYGVVASSNARRLRPYGVWVQHKIKSAEWFLNHPDDIRSSCFLEEVATEFDIQGLELDWAVVCWDADFRMEDGRFTYYSFRGSKWNRIGSSTDQQYLKNSYRVLLTRARQGFIIFIPEGCNNDKTRKPEFYDGIFEYLQSLGLQTI